MTRLRILFATVFLLLPFAAAADLSADSLPAGTVWYMHADLAQMRSTESGSELYSWLQDEVIVEVNDEIGIDLNDEVDRITAFSDSPEGAVVVVEGPLSDELRGQILSLARSEGDIDEREHGGKSYYLFGEEGSPGKHNSLESFEDGGYFTFAVEGKVIAASDEERLKAMIDNNGRITGAEAHGNAIFVLTADKEFVQAGMRTGEFADEDDDWDSTIMRSTEQAAVLVSDQGGKIAVEAKLVTTEPELTKSIGNIVNGLISLQAFNSELEPSIAGILRNTKVNVAETVLSISTVIESSAIIAILED